MNDIVMPALSNEPWTFADYGIAIGSVMLGVALFLAVMKFRRSYYEQHGRDWRDEL